MQIQKHSFGPGWSLIVQKVLLSWFVIWLHSVLCRELFCFEAESYPAVLLNQEIYQYHLGSLSKMHALSFLFFLLISSGCDHVYFEKPSPSDSDIHLCEY